MQQSSRSEVYEFNAYYNWKVTPDVPDNNFQPLVNKIINSNKSFHISWPAGSGKTELVKQLQTQITEEGEKFESLAPTNVASLLIGGITIHRFVSRLKKSSIIKNLVINYVINLYID